MYESNKSSKEVSWMTQLLTLEQVARQLSVSKRTVQRLVSQGQIETIHLSSGLVRVSEKAFERFIEKQQRNQRLAQGVKRG
jgi:excisionase family DNA binding protein